MRIRQIIPAAYLLAIVPAQPALGVSECDGKIVHFPIAADIASEQIAIGTPITLRLKQRLKGGTTAKGTKVDMEVASDVLAPDGRSVILRAGTPAYGTVSESRGAGAFGRPGKIAITCDYVAAPEGVRIPLRPAGNVTTGSNKATASVITGTVVMIPTWAAADLSINGLGLGGQRRKSAAPPLLGIGAGVLAGSLWRGGSAELKEGRMLHSEVAVDTKLRVGAPAE